MTIVKNKLKVFRAMAKKYWDIETHNYLSTYGYLPPTITSESSEGLITQEAFSKAVSDFQKFMELNTTGTLDKETIQLMSTPRCGVKDVDYEYDSRTKRFVMQGSKWHKSKITFAIRKYPSAEIKHREIRNAFQDAFGVWSKHAKLSFIHKKKGKADIDISFVKGRHGDENPFDGPGGNLAHAYFPNFGGDAHFDDSENWSVTTKNGTNLIQVAVHEFGHSLGLAHSDAKKSIMAPIYTGNWKHIQLGEDDIKGIQRLYGKKPKAKATNQKSAFHKICTSKHPPSIDTVFLDRNDNVIIFMGKKYWKMTEKGVDPNSKKKIADKWPELPDNINAAFTYTDGKTYFFKGSQFWCYKGKKLEAGYPESINNYFPDVPKSVDAAVSKGKYIYFFKDAEYWKYDSITKGNETKTSKNGKSISKWPGLPNKVNAAFYGRDRKCFYFVKEDSYWRYNSTDSKGNNNGFQRSVKEWWFKCKNPVNNWL
ncbi:hypothetical protein RUM44_003946 [Polyplax serrata]|uniref:Peptidase metallopeptidase domain-containing protein n=1 Tax=Polyplax serrata TaxID=468196 RepID=A0ABR1B1G4_POLSC